MNTEKNRPSLGKIFKCIWKVLFGPFTKYYGLWSSVLPLANCQHLKIHDFTSPLLTQHFFFFLLIYLFWYFYPQFLTNNYVQSLLNMPFSARTRWDLPRVHKDIAQTVTNFLLFSGENKNNLPFHKILKAITLEVNMITRQMTPFSSSTLWALYPLICFTSRPSKFNTTGSPLCIKFCSVKYTFTCQRRHFQAC